MLYIKQIFCKNKGGICEEGGVLALVIRKFNESKKEMEDYVL
jgi:hypothetical protein